MLKRSEKVKYRGRFQAPATAFLMRGVPVSDGMRNALRRTAGGRNFGADYN
ncbi:MAG TPA: hypothetical protein VGB00_13725 [Pyrinomonadaceae bacterium]